MNIKIIFFLTGCIASPHLFSHLVYVENKSPYEAKSIGVGRSNGQKTLIKSSIKPSNKAIFEIGDNCSVETVWAIMKLDDGQEYGITDIYKTNKPSTWKYFEIISTPNNGFKTQRSTPPADQSTPPLIYVENKTPYVASSVGVGRGNGCKTLIASQVQPGDTEIFQNEAQCPLETVWGSILLPSGQLYGITDIYKTNKPSTWKYFEIVSAPNNSFKTQKNTTKV